MSRRDVVAGAVGAGLAGPLAAGAASPSALPVGALLPGARVEPERAEMVAVPGGRAWVRVDGDLAGPRPPLVLIHGGPGSSHWYFVNATAMAGERAIILYDQLDSGRSDRPNDPANWRVDRFVDELEAIRAHLDVPRWHVLGASWGGTVALEYAARRPRALAGLVLQSALISTPVWLRDARRLKDAMPAETRRLLDLCDTPGAASRADCDAATDAFYRRYIRRFDPPPPIAAYRDALPSSFSPAIYNHMWGRAEFSATGTLSDYDGTALLARLDGRRTLFVTGEHDEALPETVRDFAAKLPGSACEVVANAAHSVMNDAPAAYVALLRRWLATVDAA